MDLDRLRDVPHARKKVVIGGALMLAAGLCAFGQSPALAGHWEVQFSEPVVVASGSVTPGTSATITLPPAKPTAIDGQYTYFGTWTGGYNGHAGTGALTSTWNVWLTWIPTNNADPATPLTEWDGTPSWAGDDLTGGTYIAVPSYMSVADNLGEPNNSTPRIVGTGVATHGYYYEGGYNLPAMEYPVTYSGNGEGVGFGVTRSIIDTFYGSDGGGATFVYGFTTPVDPIGY